MTIFPSISASQLHMSQRAQMPCGCVGVALGHDDAGVQMGIQDNACPQHNAADVVSIDKGALVTLVQPTSPGAA
jgi:hypothetical protein